jgi:hypothetical protein
MMSCFEGNVNAICRKLFKWGMKVEEEYSGVEGFFLLFYLLL